MSGWQRPATNTAVTSQAKYMRKPYVACGDMQSHGIYAAIDAHVCSVSKRLHTGHEVKHAMESPTRNVGTRHLASVCADQLMPMCCAVTASSTSELPSVRVMTGGCRPRRRRGHSRLVRRAALHAPPLRVL